MLNIESAKSHQDCFRRPHLLYPNNLRTTEFQQTFNSSICLQTQGQSMNCIHQNWWTIWFLQW